MLYWLVGACLCGEVLGGRGGAWVGRGIGWGAVVAVVTRGGRERGGGGGELVVRECVCARLVFFMRELFGLCFLCACSLFLFLF